MACKIFDCRCKSKIAPCPLCGRRVHTAGRLVSHHPPCLAFTLDDEPRRKLVVAELVRWRTLRSSTS